MKGRCVARGGWGDLSPFHPKILQFARVFEKKPETPSKIFRYKKFANPSSKNFWLRR